MALPLLYQHLIIEQFDQIVNLIDERLKEAKKLKRTSISDQHEVAIEEIRLCELLRIFLKYFERYWINIITPDMFCVQGLQHRTNNLAEGMSSHLYCNYFTIHNVLV
jgi:hypothetical protein